MRGTHARLEKDSSQPNHTAFHGGDRSEIGRKGRFRLYNCVANWLLWPRQITLHEQDFTDGGTTIPGCPHHSEENILQPKKKHSPIKKLIEQPWSADARHIHPRIFVAVILGCPLLSSSPIPVQTTAHKLCSNKFIGRFFFTAFDWTFHQPFSRLQISFKPYPSSFDARKWATAFSTSSG